MTNVTASLTEHCHAALPAAPQLVAFLGSDDPALRDYAAWALGNLAGDGPALRDVLLAQGAFPALLPLVAPPQPPGVVRSAAFALSNLVRGQGAPVAAMLDAGLAPALLAALAAPAPADDAITAQVLYIIVYLTGARRGGGGIPNPV